MLDDGINAVNTREKAAQSVARLLASIERNIASGVWQVGAKLPTERQLEKELGVSRNTLRRGLRRLEEEGKIIRHVGRGSFVARVDHPIVPQSPIAPLDEGARSRERPTQTDISGNNATLMAKISGASPVDLMEVRLVIEPAAAELAAHRASAANLAKMEECLLRMRQATDIPEYEYWDGMLHVTVTAAARNELLSAVYEAINEARNQPEWEQLKVRSVTPERRAQYHEQHEKIVAALLVRDSDAARNAVADHLRLVRDNLLAS